MSKIPDKFKRYAKFLKFILTYWNSEVFKHARSQALSDLDFEEDDEGNKSTYDEPQELADDLVEMGPTFVKLGQLLSTRPDLLPDHYLDALSSLQDKVDPVDYEEIAEVVEEEIGMRISKAFESFDSDPLASASIGQVHTAVLASGKKVVVKIQRPGVRKRFLNDLDTLKEITDFVVKHSGTAQKYALDTVLEEFRYMLLNELDYRQEAENLMTLGENLKEFERIVVPQPVSDYSSSKVLTMDFIDGKKVTELGELKRLETDFTGMVDELVDAYLKQIVFDGFVHADPHPGNVHLTEDDKVALIDLGMVVRFSEEFQENLLKLLIALSQSDGEAVSDVLLEVSERSEVADIDSFRKQINRLVLSAKDRKVKEMQTGRLIIQMNRMAAEHGVIIAVELNILGKILLNMDRIIAVLAPDYDFQEELGSKVEKLMIKKAQKELKSGNLFAKALEAKRLAEVLPDRINKISERFANSDFELKVNVNAFDEKRLTDGFQKVANRIALSLIIASMIIGAALMMRIPSGFTILGYPGMPILLFIAAAIIGFVLIVGIILGDRIKQK